MNKELIVYYSRADENYVNGKLKYLEIGNTEVVANMVHDLTGADLFKIVQEEPYAKGYNDCIAQAQMDQKGNVRPKLKGYPESIEEYDIIYLGYPNYWSTMPMAVFTFLEHFDFDKKVIKPFCTHEGSGLGGSLHDIGKLCPNATIDEGIALYGSKVNQSMQELKGWIER